jgi:N-acetylneuraminate synthase
MNITKHLDKVKTSEKYRYSYVVSEIGINHNGNLSEALKLIDASHECGVDAVKFQKRSLENLYTQKILEDPNSAEWTF